MQRYTNHLFFLLEYLDLQFFFMKAALINFLFNHSCKNLSKHNHTPFYPR